MIVNIIPLQLQSLPLLIKCTEILSDVLIMSIGHAALKILRKMGKEEE